MIPPLPPPDRLERGADGSVEATFALPADYPGFVGHFPGEPVLPGMCHLAMAVLAAEGLRGAPLRLRAVERARFRVKTLPGRDLVIRIAAAGTAQAGERFESRHFQDGTAVAEIRFVAAPRAPARTPPAE